VRDQEIVGFGGSLLEAGLISLRSLDTPHEEQVLQALFDPAKGAGFSAMKTVIGATDFMSALGCGVSRPFPVPPPGSARRVVYALFEC
jgi:O-glycosyl hydrolase